MIYLQYKKTKHGNIQMISADVLTIDKITSDIASYIQTSLEQNGNTKVKLSVGSFTGAKMLSGYGAEIPIQISSVGTVNTDIKSEFISQGINQTIHRIYMDIVCEVSVLTPFNTITQDIYNKVLLGENVIIGQIPETYYNFERNGK